MQQLYLPHADGTLQPFRFEPSGIDEKPADRGQRPAHPWPRVAYAAAHVVCNPLADIDPWTAVAVDWDQTLAYREYLWDLGFGVAEAMDTAQRGMGLDWANSLELIGRSVAAAKRRGAVVACGVGTDHLPAGPGVTIDAVIRAYEQQIGEVEALGGRTILMASRALAACARGPQDYAAVYDSVIGQLSEPTILHWLGDMFDEALSGYWGGSDPWATMECCLEIINRNAARIDGIKVSLFSPELEIALRRRLPSGVRMYTGNDFDFPDLIAGDEAGNSDALLGIFDPIAPVAARALTVLGAGDRAAYDAILAPTVPLARHIFRAPTRFYKTGITFLAYLNGHQDHFTMIGGYESARSTQHLATLIRLADAAGIIRDPDLAASRARAVLIARGVAT
jgi:hypothetical protein